MEGTRQRLELGSAATATPDGVIGRLDGQSAACGKGEAGT
jgi:hypothetical protein